MAKYQRRFSKDSARGSQAELDKLEDQDVRLKNFVQTVTKFYPKKVLILSVAAREVAKKTSLCFPWQARNKAVE